MIDRTKTEVDAAQATLRNLVTMLEPTGQSGFEGFLSSVLSEITGKPFHVVKSGTQSGSDVRSDRLNLVHLVLESKRYGSRTWLPLDNLRSKLHDASKAEPAADVWVLATTRVIDSTYRDTLVSDGEDYGIDVIVWDWPEHSAKLADLAVVCALARDACASYLRSESDLTKALCNIRRHADFERKASDLRDGLLRPELGYANCGEKCGQWLKEAQTTLAKAKSRLGGRHDLHPSESEYRVVPRQRVSDKLSLWLKNGEAGIVALVGEEGTGKSWAALDWCGGVSKSDAVAPVIVYIPAKQLEGSDAKSDIADALSRQVAKKASFWLRRLMLWEKVGGSGLRVLVVVDGLNQNFLFKRWADWFQPLLEEDVRSMYRVVVTCWANWWSEGLKRLVSLEPSPVEIEVTAFDDGELDTMLVKMGRTRGDFTEPVLNLMRVPRLATLVMTHRKKLADSGDVTAERVVYEDWKDRMHDDGSTRGLDDARMKVFVTDLGKKLQKDVDGIVSERNIREILSHKSGKVGEYLDAAVVELTSGGWFIPGDRPDTFRLETDKLPYVLGAALTAELKRQPGSSSGDVGVIIAEFLDPLKSHSLGAKILRAATTIALVEEDTSHAVQSAVLKRWLDEQNFGSEDFESLWRIVGLNAELFLGIAEDNWLSAQTDLFRDEILAKACAYAADYSRFDTALKHKLVEWLGTVWADPIVAEQGYSIGDDAGAREDVRLQHQAWEESEESRSFQCVRLKEEGEWDWIGHHAVSVMSFLPRAPYVAALEAWCLSRALMPKAWHFDEFAWLLRVNQKDPDETGKAMDNVVRRLERHSHRVVCRRAAKIARDALSHVRRGGAGRSHKPRDVEVEQSPRQEEHAAALKGDALFGAVRDYLGPDGWKRWSAGAGAALIDKLVERELHVGSREVDLLLRHVAEIVNIVSPNLRRRLAAAFEQGRAEAVSSGGKPRLAAKLAGAALAMRLYEATALEQCRMLLASGNVAMGPEWGPICRRVSERDLDNLDFAGASAEGMVLWLEFVGGRLDKALIRNMGILESLTTSEQQEVRLRAVEMAAYGGHVDALVRFSRSSYAVSDRRSEAGSREELARNRALLELEARGPENASHARISSECAALRVRLSAEGEGPTDAELDDFARYLEGELEATLVAKSWSAPRFWFSYRECVELLIARGADAVPDWLRPWGENVNGFQAECALMSDFPVLDTARALKHQEPELALRVFQSLRNASKHNIFSANRIEDLPFELARSEASDAVCDERLAAIATDKELMEVAHVCHRHAREDWLVERVTALERSSRPVDVAKAFTLLGLFDSGEEADLLWTEFASRPPGDHWLAKVLSDSRADYERNRIARAAFEDFWRTKDEREARHAWKRVEENCDRRIGLWIEQLLPPLAGTPYARRLAWSLNWKSVKYAVKKNSDKRRRLLFHTRVGSPGMAPWGE